MTWGKSETVYAEAYDTLQSFINWCVCVALPVAVVVWFVGGNQ